MDYFLTQCGLFSSMVHSNNSHANFYSSLDIDDDCSVRHDLIPSNRTRLQSLSIYDFPLVNSPSSPTFPLSNQTRHNFQTDDDVLFEIDLDSDEKMRNLSPLVTSELTVTNDAILHLTNAIIYEIMGFSNQIIILDDRLNVRTSIEILIQTNISSATIWHSKKGIVYDVLSPMSLLVALSSRFINNTESISPLDSLLCELFPVAYYSQLITISNESTLYSACKTLFNNDLLLLPVVNLINQSICFILSIKDILSVLYLRIYSCHTMPVIRLTLKQLNIVPDPVSVLFPSDSMLKVFQNFCKQTSIVPIVSEEGILVNTFTVIDGIRVLAEYPSVNLTTFSVTDALIQIFPEEPRIFTCSISDSMIRILSIFLKSNAFSLILVNEVGYPIGIICLLDILKMLVYLLIK
eukprot:TRINITY_DN14217_c0_g1_i1.p1 TRINITY_DN14217_c0_g1~~TRINITY_DN14217_c0_g1_i1.p1  ORF type:complete len:407 (+),score=1.69 TRINITY_DN14217_c0_g1_i1:88-1308(+)